VLDRLGWRDRLRIWSPKDISYFEDLPAGTEMLVFAGIVASDLLLQARYDVRPVERVPGATESLYAKYQGELLKRVEAAAHADLSLGPALWQVISGRLFGIRELLERAGAEFAALRGPQELPLVELTGEIYVRSVDFSNDSLVEKLEARGLRVHLSPKTEWMNYCGYIGRRTKAHVGFTDRFSQRLQHRIESVALAAIAPHMDWPAPPTVTEALEAARPYVNDALEGEAVLTVGGPLHEWRHGQIAAVVSVGPLECMPTKIAEAQFFHIAEQHKALVLTLPMNGDPLDPQALDNFTFEVHARHNARRRR